MEHPWNSVVPYETIDPYLRLYIYKHWSRSEAALRLTDFESLLTAENIFKQIVYYGSYDRLRLNLRHIYGRAGLDEKENLGVTYLINTLHLV